MSSSDLGQQGLMRKRLKNDLDLTEHNRPFGQSVGQSVNQLVSQPVNQLVRRQTDRQTVSPSIRQSVSQSVIQSDSHSNNQSIKMTLLQVVQPMSGRKNRPLFWIRTYMKLSFQYKDGPQTLYHQDLNLSKTQIRKSMLDLCTETTRAKL